VMRAIRRARCEPLWALPARVSQGPQGEDGCSPDSEAGTGANPDRRLSRRKVSRLRLAERILFNTPPRNQLSTHASPGARDYIKLITHNGAQT
jgi:hypothetical protein